MAEMFACPFGIAVWTWYLAPGVSLKSSIILKASIMPAVLASDPRGMGLLIEFLRFLVAFVLVLVLVFAFASVCSWSGKATISRGLGGIGAMLTGAFIYYFLLNDAFSKDLWQGVSVWLVCCIPILMSLHFILQNSLEFDAYCKAKRPMNPDRSL